MERLHRITVFVDDVHHVLGGSLVVNAETSSEVVVPLSVGPFDTPTEVVERAMARLDKQLTLW